MKIDFETTDLRPLIQTVVAETLRQADEQERRAGDRLAYKEPEAAALLGVERHVLRDARLRGELAGSRVGKSVVYERDELLRFLRQRRG